MRLVKRINELFFGEAEVLKKEGISDAVIKEIQSELKQYVKDWDEEFLNASIIYTLVWKDGPVYDARTADAIELKLVEVKSFIELMADGAGYEISTDLVDVELVKKVFNAAIGLHGTVLFKQDVNFENFTRDNNKIRDEFSETVEVTFDYKITGFEYDKREDTVFFSAKISNLVM